MRRVWLAALALVVSVPAARAGADPAALKGAIDRDIGRMRRDQNSIDQARKQVREAKRRVQETKGDGGDIKDAKGDLRDARDTLKQDNRNLAEDKKRYVEAENVYYDATGAHAYPLLYDRLTGEKPAPPEAPPSPPQAGTIPEPGTGREMTGDDYTGSGPLIEAPPASGAPAPATTATSPLAAPAPAQAAPSGPRQPVEPSFMPLGEDAGGAPVGSAASPASAASAGAGAPPRVDAGALEPPPPGAAVPAPPRQSAAPPAGGGTSPAAPHVYEAMRDLAGDRLSDALSAAQAAVRADPGSADAHRVLSQVYARGRRWQDAESEALEAVRLNAKDAGAQRALAWAALHLGKYDEALEAANQALALDPRDARAYALRAFALEKLGRRDAMLADLRRAAELDPGRFKALLARAEKGLSVFDPKDEELYRLIEDAVPVGRGRSGVGAGAAAAAALIALGLLPFWRRLNVQTVETFAMGGPRPAPRPRARASDGVAEAEQAGLLAGKYELRVLIGRGGMAQVWEGYDRSLRRAAAVKKVIIPEGPRAESRRQLALQEARTLATLRHPNIVDIFEVLELESGLYLVFEFLRGKTLQQILAEHKRLPWARARVVLAPACAALEFAHARGFVHRDFKPSNIMVLPDGRVKVMDFGIARALSEGAAPVEAGVDAAAAARPIATARTSNLVGTPGYRPPEAERGVVSVAFDVYSLGAVAYESLTGELPPRPGPGSTERVWQRLQQVVPDLPPRVGKAIQASLHPDMGQRAQSVQFFRCQALET